MTDKIKIFCEKCIMDNDEQIVLPVEMPKSRNELINYMKEHFNYNKPFILSNKQFEKLIRQNFIRFKCPKCGWEKISKLQEILIQGFINAYVCKTCELDVCLWVNCTKGGYIKNDA